MSDGITLIKGPEESIKAFNQRLEEVYLKNPITDVEAALVSGTPALTLLTETVYEDDEEAEDGPASDEGPDAEEDGDDGLQTDGPPLGCRIVELRADTAEEAARSERWCAKVLGLAAGAIVDVKYLTGQRMGWAKPPAEATNPAMDTRGAKEAPYAYVAQNVTYLLVLWELDEADEGEDDEDETEADTKDVEVLPPGKK